MKDKFDYIIFHRNCFDGFTGFFLFIKTKQWSSKPIVYPDIPSTTEVPPDIDGRNVISIDVAYRPEIVKEIASRANKFLFIDHHVSHHNETVDLNLQSPHEIVYDTEYSGASLVWKHFYGSRDTMPDFVKYIEDNDIGAWKYPETLPFLAYLEVHYKLDPTFKNLRKWDKLLDNNVVAQHVADGQKYIVYKKYLIKRNSKHYVLKKFPSQKILDTLDTNDIITSVGQYTVAVTSNACPSVTLIGKQIVEDVDCDFVMIWNRRLDKKYTIVSLRSNSTDIGTIAKVMGGGGHKFAAAFSIDYDIMELFS